MQQKAYTKVHMAINIMKIDIIKKVKMLKMHMKAIRPAHIDLTPDEIKEYLSPEQYKLYKLNI